MASIQELFPNVEDLLATPVEDIALVLLRLARDIIQNGMFWPEQVRQIPMSSQVQYYPFHLKQRIDAHLSEAWQWLRQNMFIVPAAGMNGSNGWMIITPKGEEAAQGKDLSQLRIALAFPKGLIHPVIREKVWSALARGDLDDAVFAAFKAVEVAVREAGRFAASDVGVQLMRKAFDKATGPLVEQSHPEAEREALAHLFAGSIGSYKNPHSHRTVNLSDLQEAQEQVVLASHLLRIVDTRMAQNKHG